MTFYSRYRRQSVLTENTRAIICALCVAFLWCAVSEMDYREAVSVECSK